MSVSFSTKWTQTFPPPGPINGTNLPSQAGKVFVVTGGSHGLGYELSKVLYNAGAKVYILTRSRTRCEEAIAKIESAYQVNKNPAKKPGSLKFIAMDLMDLESVKTGAREFLASEGPDGRLDILFNNAGTGGRKNAPLSAQGNEYHFATNTLGPFLLARLLTPILASTAKMSPEGSVRVVWPASMLVETGSPKGGVRQDFLDNQQTKMDYVELYAQSKVGGWFLSSELSRRHSIEDPRAPVVFLAGNPGTYATNMWQYTPWLLYIILRPLLNDPTLHGPETYLWMAFSDEVTVEDAVAGRYAMCNGRWHPGQRGDLLQALRGKDQGGSGWAADVYNWCEDKIQAYLN